MADRYWRGGTGTWNTTTTNWSTASGGSGGASAPGASDTAIFDGNSSPSGVSYTVTRTATATLGALTASNPSAGTLTMAGSSAWTFGASNGTVNIGPSITWTNTGAITFSGTVDGTLFLKGSTTIPNNMILNRAGFNLTLSGNVATTGVLTLTAGTLLCNGYNITAATSTWTGGNINFGANGTISLSASSGTVLTASAWTGAASNTSNGQVILSNAATTSNRTVNISGSIGNIGVPLTLYGAGTVTITNGVVGDFNTLNFTGSLNYGTVQGGNLWTKGSVRIGSHSVPAGAIVLYSSGGIVPKLLQGQAPFSFNSASSGNYILSGYLKSTSATIFASNMKLDLNGYTFNTPSFTFNNSGSTATINFNGGTIQLNGGGWTVAGFYDSDSGNYYRTSLNILGSGTITKDSIFAGGSYTFYDDSNDPKYTYGATTPSDYSNISIESFSGGELIIRGFGTTIGNAYSPGAYVKFIGTGALANKVKNLFTDSSQFDPTGAIFTTGVAGVKQDIVYVGSNPKINLYNAQISYLNASPPSTWFAYTNDGNNDYGNNTNIYFSYPPIASRLFANGNLSIGRGLDEINLTDSTAYRITKDGIAFTKNFDEVTLNPINNGLARSLYSNGTLMIAGTLDEVTGIS